MLKISKKHCDFIVEDTPSLKLFIIFIVFSLRPLRLCDGLNCYLLGRWIRPREIAFTFAPRPVA